jgi:hypothetical protein
MPMFETWCHVLEMISLTVAIASPETLANHMIELVLPWGFLVPLRACRLTAAAASIGFMAVIASGGNYAFLNHLTAVPMLVCLDDAFLRACRAASPGALQPSNISAPQVQEASSSSSAGATWRRVIRCVVVLCVCVLISIKTFVPDARGRSPLQNLFGQHPWLETYDDLFLVNAYGYLYARASRILQLLEGLVFSVEMGRQTCVGVSQSLTGLRLVVMP